MRVLVACEESQAVTKALRARGHEAYSCDLQECSGGVAKWHIRADVFDVLSDTTKYGRWDMMIAFPPCTYLAVSGARWYYHPDDGGLPYEERRPHPRFPDRRADREAAVDFFLRLAHAPVPRIAIENPVGIISSRWRKPDQIVQPWQFGDKASKKTCLWLKNLPPLIPTKVVDKGEMVTYSNGKRMAKWYAEALTTASSAEERRRLRSKTFAGIAQAMATQWTSPSP